MAILETVESLWILYRLTGDKTYQDKAWEIFEVSLFNNIFGEKG